MVEQQALESFGDSDKQALLKSRIRADVKRGMTDVLNVGFPKGQRLFYPKHMMTVVMPEPGATFSVPVETGNWLVQNFSSKLQLVKGVLPSNFTPPPGYTLVPISQAQGAVLPVPTAEELLVEPEQPKKAKTKE